MRECGTLLHITSLPGKYGVGTMGKQARSFVDFLKRSGQSYWQILPLTPTSYGDSPYQSCSAYAGNHYLIDLELLVEEGLLNEAELSAITWSERDDKADFGLLYQNRLKVLKLAFERYGDQPEFREFRHHNGSWLPDYALFMALKDENKGLPWYQWPKPLRFRDPDAMWEARCRLRSEIQLYSFVQFLFFRQWTELRCYAHDSGVKIIGDVPIYVPLDSVEVWSSPELFQLDGDLKPTRVAGCPPDGFSADGQLWGNPLYRWDRMEEDGYTWWINRLRAAGTLYDVIRLDHFRGFEAYWSIPYGDKTARGGKWVKGPGLPFIRFIQKNLPELEMIAEDLGFLTQEVLDLRDDSGYPGMKVLGFAFDGCGPCAYLPHVYPSNCVCYTGTHDNMTTKQWFDTAKEEAVAFAKAYMALTEQEGLVWGTVRTAMSSPAELCIIQMQDYLNLGAEARMNLPGTVSDRNWTWRMEDGALTDALAKRIHTLATLYDRCGQA